MAAGLIAVVAVRPDTLQPVGTFVSDMFVQEADADNGDSTIPPSTKGRQATRARTASRTPGEPEHDKANDPAGERQKQKNHQRG